MNKPEIRHLPEGRCWDKTRILQPTGIVLHAISARNTEPSDPYILLEVENILKQYGFSAHLALTRDAQWYEWVPLNRQAWHAGRSKLRDQTHLNEFTIGIEVFGKEDEDFADVQYRALAAKLVELTKTFSMSTNMIKPHSEVSSSFVRSDPKWDPGNYFDMLYLGMLMQELWI